MIEVGALHALALAAAGDQATALTTLAGALALAGPDGYVRVFADEGTAMARLLADSPPPNALGGSSSPTVSPSTTWIR